MVEYGGTQENIAKIIRQVVPRTHESNCDDINATCWCEVAIPLMPCKTE